MALTKADMAESLFNELGLNKREARELVDLCFEELVACVWRIPILSHKSVCLVMSALIVTMVA